MSEAEQLYLKIGEELDGVVLSNMFGKPCLKLNGKAFAAFFQDEMVFKLKGKDHEIAIKLKGSKLFDPSGKGRPMKEWVQVPFEYSVQWKAFAERAKEILIEQ